MNPTIEWFIPRETENLEMVAKRIADVWRKLHPIPPIPIPRYGLKNNASAFLKAAVESQGVSVVLI
jgi:hypothetical protein